MTTLDGDWICEQEDDDGPACFAVWEHCPDCLKEVPELENYDGGLAPKGKGIPFSKSYGNLWHDQCEQLGKKYDICISCTGSGGAYICGVHDIDTP